MKAGGSSRQGALRLVLWTKVSFTLVWAGLLLFVSPDTFQTLGVDRPQEACGCPPR